MANRPIFYANQQRHDTAPVLELLVDFQWHPGFSIAQKQKSIASLHSAVIATTGLVSPLEISSKSTSPLGHELSAFNLQLSFRCSSMLTASVETFYQGGKIFNGVPRADHDRFKLGPRESRQRVKELGAGGRLSGWEIGRYTFSLSSGVDFYNWLYLGALHQHPELLNDLISHDCFTDIEFNPKKSLACQARSAALARYCVLNEGSLLPYLKRMSSSHEMKACQESSAKGDNYSNDTNAQLMLDFQSLRP